jgi:hypothetical protein
LFCFFQGKRDLHILTVGILTYTNDQRYQSLHADGSDEWTLRITSPQPRDSGIYEVMMALMGDGRRGRDAGAGNSV